MKWSQGRNSANFSRHKRTTPCTCTGRISGHDCIQITSIQLGKAHGNWKAAAWCVASAAHTPSTDASMCTGCCGLLLCPQRSVRLLVLADVYDVKNAAYGPHKGFRLISTGNTIAAKLQIHHHIRTISSAISTIGNMGKKSLSTELGSVTESSGKRSSQASSSQQQQQLLQPGFDVVHCCCTPAEPFEHPACKFGQWLKGQISAEPRC